MINVCLNEIIHTLPASAKTFVGDVVFLFLMVFTQDLWSSAWVLSFARSSWFERQVMVGEKGLLCFAISECQITTQAYTCSCFGNREHVEKYYISFVCVAVWETYFLLEMSHILQKLKM